MEKVDLSYIRSVAADDDELVGQFIEIFVSQVPQFSQDIHAAREAENWRELAAVAHKAKSSIASMGLNELALNMKRLEMLAKTIYVENTTDDDSMFHSIKAQIASMPDELSEWISQNKNVNAIDELIKFYNLRVDYAVGELNNLIDRKI